MAFTVMAPQPPEPTIGSAITQLLQGGVQGWLGRKELEDNKLKNKLVQAQIDKILYDISLPLEKKITLKAQAEMDAMMDYYQKYETAKANQQPSVSDSSYQSQANVEQYEEGALYEDDETGEAFIYRNGKMTPVGSGRRYGRNPAGETAKYYPTRRY